MNLNIQRASVHTWALVLLVMINEMGKDILCILDERNG